MAKNLNTYLNKTTDVSPLVIFRIGFGIMMCYGIIRFWLKGWIETIYIEPDFHFSYFGFEWVKPLGNFTLYFIYYLWFSYNFYRLGF